MEFALGEPRTALYFIAITYDWTWSSIEELFALALADGASIHLLNWRTLHLALILGRSEEALTIGHRAAELDPLAAAALTGLQFALLQLHRYDEAERSPSPGASTRPLRGSIARTGSATRRCRC
jgi:hypothetical protein